MSCVFCAIASGEAPAHLVHDDGRCIAFLDINPATRGHCLVVPRGHVEDIWSADSETFGDVARATHTVAALVRDRLAPDGLTLFQANRHHGWQDGFHLHVHVVPRYRNDSLVRPWTLSSRGRDDLADVARVLTSS